MINGGWLSPHILWGIIAEDWMSEQICGISTDEIRKNLINPDDFKIEVFKTIDSTNTYVGKKGSEGEQEGFLAVAEEQSNGRGRRGRTFYSPQNSGIYFSLLLKPNQKPERAMMITVMAAVAVCEALKQLTGTKPEIKWVNDIYIKARKVCGILTEASLLENTGTLHYCVLGIGINLFCPKEGFPDEIRQVAGYVTDEFSDIRAKVVAETMNAFYRLYQGFHVTEAVEKYRSFSFMVGRRVTVLGNELMKEAQVLEIDDNCGLVVRYDDGMTETLSSGEVSIKL